MTNESDTDILELTATIVSAHVRNNQVAPNALPALIQSVRRSLATAGTAEPASAPAPPIPPVPIRKSVFPNYIVCLEAGQKLKMLNRLRKFGFSARP